MREVTLLQLARFLRHPVRYFVNSRLQIYLGEQEPEEDDEPFALDSLQGFFLKQRLVMLVAFVKPEPLQALADILGQPGVTPAVDRTFPLEETAAGMRALVSSQVHGKLVIRVAA